MASSASKASKHQAHIHYKARNRQIAEDRLIARIKELIIEMVKPEALKKKDD